MISLVQVMLLRRLELSKRTLQRQSRSEVKQSSPSASRRWLNVPWKRRSNNAPFWRSLLKLLRSFPAPSSAPIQAVPALLPSLRLLVAQENKSRSKRFRSKMSKLDLCASPNLLSGMSNPVLRRVTNTVFLQETSVPRELPLRDQQPQQLQRQQPSHLKIKLPKLLVFRDPLQFLPKFLLPEVLPHQSLVLIPPVPSTSVLLLQLKNPPSPPQALAAVAPRQSPRTTPQT